MRAFFTVKGRLRCSIAWMALCTGWAVMSACSGQTSAPASEAKAEAGPALVPGHYVTEKGWGHLDIVPSDRGLRFALETVTGEDICSLQGEIAGDRGTAAPERGEAPCVVRFKASVGGGIGVAPVTATQCKTFCGYNGGFEGQYLSVPDTCSDAGLNAARQQFKNLYEAKQYKQALEVLSPVFAKCLPTLTWEQEGELRNDLAITQHHNGMDRQCLATLAPYAEDAAKDDDAVMDAWPPALVDRYLGIVRSARTNLHLCQKGSGAQ
ncbi:hypothetical protein [Pseudoxanthomonas winnipegensis]|uniref:hypothetical protein n=1 Tax=Pseudoxanthomonas winnipegensis TaxID=2480810 RepID=UPI001F2838E4|nr:hypothetical protein [Pseudoxanthomonas winnipegensis]